MYLLGQFKEMQMKNQLTYIEINKQIATLTYELRSYRLRSVLKTLASLKKKDTRLVNLEKLLTKELNKTLHDYIAIDTLLEEFESIL